MYKRQVLPLADRVSAAGTINSVNIQLADGSWAGFSESFNSYKTLNKADLLTHTGGSQAVHAVPTNPREGQRIEPLEDLTILGSGILTVGEGTNGLNWGWLNAVGSIFPAPPNVIFNAVVAYNADPSLQANIRNKVTVRRAVSNVLTRLWINGKSYALTPAGGNPVSYTHLTLPTILLV